jgi:Spy/CpxP family protein refolding chaperone
MKLIKTAVTVAMFVAAGAAFAGPGMGHGNHQPGERIVKALNLDATRAAQVTAIMTDAKTQRVALHESMKGKRGDPAAREAAHAQMRSIGEATKAKLATVLSVDEMAKLKEMRKGMGHGNGPARG